MRRGSWEVHTVQGLFVPGLEGRVLSVSSASPQSWGHGQSRAWQEGMRGCRGLVAGSRVSGQSPGGAGDWDKVSSYTKGIGDGRPALPEVESTGREDSWGL